MQLSRVDETTFRKGLLGLTSELVPQATTADARVVPVIGEIATDDR